MRKPAADAGAPHPDRHLINYQDIGNYLEALCDLAGVGAVYEHLVGPLPDAGLSREMIVAIDVQLCQALEERFPIHQGILDGDGLSLQVTPFHMVVHFNGLDPNDEFGYYPDPIKLMLCLALSYEIEWWDDYDLVDEDKDKWWQDQRDCYHLPPLADLDVDAIQVAIMQMRDAPPPWNGLYAIYEWITGQAGNPFVDWTCEEYALESSPMEDFDWSVESVEQMTALYAAADRQVFEPMRRLNDHCAHDAAALATCFDLVLGRASPVVGITSEGTGDGRLLYEILATECEDHA